MEELDLVDEQDNIVGAVTRDEAHEKGLLHRAVAIFVFDFTGRLFVQVHKKSGGLYDHSIGGHVGLGESYLDAARREAYEELGITDELVEVGGALAELEFNILSRHHFIIYECHPNSDWKFMPNDEVEEIIPMEIKDIVAQIKKYGKQKFTGGFMLTMREYLKLKDNN